MTCVVPPGAKVALQQQVAVVAAQLPQTISWSVHSSWDAMRAIQLPAQDRRFDLKASVLGGWSPGKGLAALSLGVKSCWGPNILAYLKEHREKYLH